MDRTGSIAGPPSDTRLLRAGETCWRIERADRVAFLMEGAAFFSAAKAAMRDARHSILLLGWDFDPRTRLEPDAGPAEHPDTIGSFLLALKHERPELDIRVLIWDMALHLSVRHGFYPQRARGFFAGAIKFHLDDTIPFGACHHQKVLVVDDEIAFCGGADFAPNRWDTERHADENPFRVLPSGRAYPPRHDLVMMVEGPAARALGALVRERWRRATGEIAEPSGRNTEITPWPNGLQHDLRGTAVAIARTEPAWDGRPAVRESERLHVEAIASARRLILLENQYFTAPRIGRALAARLGEPHGPEIILICARHSPGFSDSLAMDGARDALIAELRRADRFGRFHAYAPYTDGGKVIIVHSKVAIIDDRLLRIGSTNLNNRSLGYDTECDLAVEAEDGPEGEGTRQAIARFRHRLIAHYLDLPIERVADAVQGSGSLAAAIDALDTAAKRRLRLFPENGAGLLGSFIAERHLGDPVGTSDAWRPWRREPGPARAHWTAALLAALCVAFFAYFFARPFRE